MINNILQFSIAILLLCLCSQPLFGQIRKEPGIILINNRTAEPRFIPQGKKISVTNSLGNRFKGRFEVISETKIRIVDQEIQASEVTKITRHTMGPKFVGIGLVTLGLAVVQLEAVTTAVASPFTQTSSEQQVSSTGLWIAAASIPFFAYKPTFKPKRWIIKLIPKEKVDLP
jgi:hypothetical protein